MKPIKPVIEFTEYETIVIPFLYEDDEGNALPLPDTIEAEARDVSDKIVCTFEVRYDVNDGFSLFSNEIIPHGEYRLNIFFTNAGFRKPSTDFGLKIHYSPTVPSSLKHLVNRG